jgi:hypothetical protein
MSLPISLSASIIHVCLSGFQPPSMTQFARVLFAYPAHKYCITPSRFALAARISAI